MLASTVIANMTNDTPAAGPVQQLPTAWSIQLTVRPPAASVADSCCAIAHGGRTEQAKNLFAAWR